MLKEIADRGLALIEIGPASGASALYQLTVELGIGYARSSTVLDYKLADRTKISVNGGWNFYDLLFTDRVITVTPGARAALSTTSGTVTCAPIGSTCASAYSGSATQYTG